MSKKISELDVAGALTGDELIPVVQSGANKKVTVNDLLPVQLQEDRTVDLDGHTLEFEGGNFYVDIENNKLFYVKNGESNYFIYGSNNTSYLRSFNPIDGGNVSEIVASTQDDEVNFRLSANFNGGANLAEIEATAEDGNASLEYTADTHTFNGQIITPDLIAKDFADDAAAAVGGVAVGQWYHTSGTLKIRLS